METRFKSSAAHVTLQPERDGMVAFKFTATKGKHAESNAKLFPLLSYLSLQSHNFKSMFSDYPTCSIWLVFKIINALRNDFS